MLATRVVWWVSQNTEQTTSAAFVRFCHLGLALIHGDGTTPFASLTRAVALLIIPSAVSLSCIPMLISPCRAAWA